MTTSREKYDNIFGLLNFLAVAMAAIGLSGCSALVACSRHEDHQGEQGPPGPSGPQGEQGSDGPRGLPGQDLIAQCPEDSQELVLNSHLVGCVRLFELDEPTTYIGCVHLCAEAGLYMMRMQDLALACVVEPDIFQDIAVRSYVDRGEVTYHQFDPHRGVPQNLSFCAKVEQFQEEVLAPGETHRMFLDLSDSLYTTESNLETEAQGNGIGHPYGCFCGKRM